jgi:DNA-binding NarL/FixJ family response regulator
MQHANGVEAAIKLRESGCESRLAFLTVHYDPDFVRACLTADAFGYVLRPRMGIDLLHTNHEAHARRIFVSPHHAQGNHA